MYRLWRLRQWILYPRENFSSWRKWRNRPGIGDYVQDCRYKILRVVDYGTTDDDLILEDGTTASWMHCCDYPRKGTKYE